MKKIYTFVESLMNGTVEIYSHVACFGSRELAEKARQAVLEENNGLPVVCSDVSETNVYESEDEVPILKEYNYEEK